MIINNEKQYIFIAISKTATSSIHAVLDYKRRQHPEPEDHHAGIKDILKLHPYAQKYFQFAFPRNTWSRIWSLYYEFRFIRIHQYSKIVRVKKPLFSEFKDFEDFCLNVFNTEWRDNIFFKSQIESITREDGTLIDFIGQFENLQSDFNKVCKLIGCPIVRLRHFRDSQYKGTYRKEYTRLAKDAVGNFYHRDILELKHDF